LRSASQESKQTATEPKSIEATIKMLKSIVTIAILAATLGPTTLAEQNASNELLVHRKLGKSGKAMVHPDLHQHGYHPHHEGKSGKSEFGGKSGKAVMEIGHVWAGSSDADDDDEADDGYKWGGDDGGHNMTSADVMDDVEMQVNLVLEPPMEEVHHDDHSSGDEDDDDDDWWSGHEHFGKSGKGSKGSKGATFGKAGKAAGKAGKSSYDMHHWGSWWSGDESDMPSPEKPGWLQSEIPSPAPTPCGKAGKECGPPPAPAPAPKPKQTLPPVCLVIPCSINGVLVSPTDVTSGSEPTVTEPPVPSPIGTLTTTPPVEDASVESIITTPPAGTSSNPTVVDVIGVPPPTPSTPKALVPITVAPSAPSESGYPTWMPTDMPTSDIQYLTESASWFQTGKAYEVDSYTRARMGDQNDIEFAFAKQEETSSSRRLLLDVVSFLGTLIITMWQVV
jgi:hypothetical protein